jgi:hypothetical protein
MFPVRYGLTLYYGKYLILDLPTRNVIAQACPLLAAEPKLIQPVLTRLSRQLYMLSVVSSPRDTAIYFAVL